MAISKTQNILIDVVGDGSSTTVDVDLERDPYFALFPSSYERVNPLPTERANPPTGAVNNGNASPSNLSFSVSLAYPILTVTFGAALSTTPQTINVTLLW